MTREERHRVTEEEIRRRVREGVKATLEEILEEEMTEHSKRAIASTPRVGKASGTVTRNGD